MTDRRTVLLVAGALALIVLVGMGSVVFLTAVGRQVPEVLASVTTTALGGLGTFLVSTRVNPAQLPAERPSVADVDVEPTTPNERWIRARLATDDHGPV